MIVLGSTGSIGVNTLNIAKKFNISIEQIEEIGNILNIKLKRARFFFKVEQSNYLFIEDYYFYFPYYPTYGTSFKIGISWNFYD